MINWVDWEFKTSKNLFISCLKCAHLLLVPFSPLNPPPPPNKTLTCCMSLSLSFSSMYVTSSPCAVSWACFLFSSSSSFTAWKIIQNTQKIWIIRNLDSISPWKNSSANCYKRPLFIFYLVKLVFSHAVLKLMWWFMCTYVIQKYTNRQMDNIIKPISNKKLEIYLDLLYAWCVQKWLWGLHTQ